MIFNRRKFVKKTLAAASIAPFFSNNLWSNLNLIEKDIKISLQCVSFANKLEFKNNNEFKNLIEEIKENSNIQLITQNKNEQEILELLNDLIEDFNEQNNLKRIESLEKKLINNLDENSYSELIRLKSQLNRE